MRATSDLEAIVGKENMLDDAAIVDDYAGDLSFVRP